ncbi:serine hydrolase domain-containing protein [Ferdinandcohnia quinoae]|uniref:Beta-lactamase family protein n=1 Tax=Fredinandcohnia quinoae TaxID=2918902 RepID=A0AAW5DZ73_9BACI|nr:serine hydrolase domain-containing protein [Fredinandcohnia sp. SECRCQ15]MCH1625950.1 beta-lactamase family protein [Fredinandcohnia sp. SECRCQ15]
MKQQVLDFLQQEIDQEHIPGAVIHVSYQNNVLFQEAIGNRVVFPKKEEMKRNTIFDLASLTKVVATLPIILKLMEDGKLHLDDKVGYHLPRFETNGKSDITIKQLLTHTSGLPAHYEYFRESLKTEQILERIYNDQLIAEAGKKVIYSDLGFITLYKLIEAVTDEKFEAYIKRELFDKLDMHETVFQPTFERQRYAATEYSDALKDYKHGIVHDDNTESMGGISGHAGLFSTIQDLANYASMIENDGVFRGNRILSKRSLQIAKMNYSPFSHEYRGLGWILKSPIHSSCGDLFSTSSYGHTGYTGTSIWFDPDIQLHVILLTNRVHFGRKDPILRLRPRLHNMIRSHF